MTIEYKNHEIVVESKEQTWGSLKGQWSGNFFCRRVGATEPKAVSVDGTFKTPTEAEENALRIAKIWVDQRLSEVVDE